MSPSFRMSSESNYFVCGFFFQMFSRGVFLSPSTLQVINWPWCRESVKQPRTMFILAFYLWQILPMTKWTGSYLWLSLFIHELNICLTHYNPLPIFCLVVKQDGNGSGRGRDKWMDGGSVSLLCHLGSWYTWLTIKHTCWKSFRLYIDITSKEHYMLRSTMSRQYLWTCCSVVVLWEKFQ